MLFLCNFKDYVHTKAQRVPNIVLDCATSGHYFVFEYLCIYICLCVFVFVCLCIMFTQKPNVCPLLCLAAQRVPIMPLRPHICTRPIIIYPPARSYQHELQTVITIINTRITVIITVIMTAVKELNPGHNTYMIIWYYKV